MPRRKSVVWDHFDETEKGKRAKCSYCPQYISISNGSLSNLARHIRKKHPTLFLLQFQDTFDFGRYSQEFVTEMIEIYKQSPSLWNSDIKEFHDSIEKAKAYENLISKFKEVDPSSNKDTVVRTINHIKNSYHKELKKIKKFSQSANENDVYTSELWYFNLLSFLQPFEIDRESNLVDYVEDENIIGNPQETNPLAITPDLEGTPSQRRKQVSLAHKNRLSEYNSVQDLSEEYMVPHESDKFDYLAKSWAMTLRTVEREQQIFAEKLISDIMYEAQMGSLCRESALCTRI